ncbi:kinase-like domain-containing protein [Thermothelomyces heterothallicus CBS 202.75]|uniref:kinase-like domain-containing protein n=1 Tax=Thermothelomyces heterothallicus CBS 202.75 TaxID=1149848 RepID=UPI003742CBD9
MARAKGIPFPDSPPPPPSLTESLPLARELLDAGGEVIYRKISSWVVKHGCGTRVTKFNLNGIRPAEVEAMQFVSEHTTIPVPRVYDVGENHLTVELIEGETLEKAWESTLSAEDRALVSRQLRDYISQLRAIKSPDGVICSFGGRPAIDTGRFYPLEGGPFADEAAFNDFLLTGLAERSPNVPGIIRGQMREDHEIVLTHGDLHGINIIVRPGVGVAAIIDWELAGFYPEYVDLAKLFSYADWTCGYYHELLNIFPQRYDAECVVEMARRPWFR